MTHTHWRAHFLQHLEATFSKPHSLAAHLAESMQYVMLAKAKHCRAQLVYLLGDYYSADIAVLDALALAIECIHSFSLVHDDLPAMDDDDWRRHQASCHRAFDEATAILCGDALLAKAFQIITEAPADDTSKVKLTHCLAVATGGYGLCGGQALDMRHHADNTDAETLKLIQANKTGALFAACTQGAYLASGQHCVTTLDSLKTFGLAIGHCFQIADDIRDTDTDSKTLGKTAGKDAMQNKATQCCVGQEAEQALQHWQQVMHTQQIALDLSSRELQDYCEILCGIR